MFKIEIKFGIITGAGICLWILSEFLLGFHTVRMNIGEYSIYFVVVIPFITIYNGIKEKRDTENNGIISLGGGIKTGLMISLIAAFITAVFIIIYFNYINPKYFEYGIAYQKEKFYLKGKTDIEFSEQLKNIKVVFSFINQLLFQILGTVGTGFIISVALSFILKNNKPFVHQ